MESIEKEFLDEAGKNEKQLWALVNSKGLLDPDVRKLYQRVCGCYEKFMLQNLQLSQLEQIEYSLWKLHYRHIDEFRKNRKLDSQSFLSDASHFYSKLLLQLRSKSAAPKLSHRLLICLGDLARYKKQLFTQQQPDNTDWSVAAQHYSEACFTWPHSGNPHNQLALLATYVGDDLLALYHFVRSLSAKEPFLDSSNNLMLILEKSRSCYDDGETPFDFLRPYKRMMNPQINGGQQNQLWPRLVRMKSFFYTKPSRLDEFPSSFAATIRDLDMLMELDDKRLEEGLMNTCSAKCAPPRAIQAICIFIFLVHNFLMKKPLWTNNSFEKDKEDDPMLGVYAFCSTFIFMGRLIERCSEGSASCCLLPSVVIFMEWLETVFDQLKSASSLSSSEEEKAAMSYFIGSLRLLLNHETQFQHSSSFTSWPEDFDQLRGFLPLAPVHDSLDFSSASMSHHTLRAIAAAKKIIVEEEEEEEQEVILFKPLTRHNSEPIHNKEGSDEMLRRATSLLSPQIPMAAAGPPSLSGWVINGGGIQEMSTACRFTPINEDEDDSVVDTSTNYSAPTPSAPLLPEDAAWFYNKEEEDGILENATPTPPLPPQDNNNSNNNVYYYYSTDVGSSSSSSNEDDVIVYPISCGMSSSEWLRQFREMNNLQGSRKQRWECTVGRNQQLADKCQKPFSRSPPYPYAVAEDKLQFLKERRLQQDASFHTRM